MNNIRFFGKFVVLPAMVVLALASCRDKDDGEVVSVEITPLNAAVVYGGTQQFSATVTVAGKASQKVSWSIDNSGSSSISADGLLTVAGDEPAATLHIIATSVADPAKKDMATVSVMTCSSPVSFGIIDDLSWSLCPGGMLAVNGAGDMLDYGDDMNVPWYDHLASITSVSIGDRITSIGSRAFYGCSDLADLTIGHSVTSIGDWAFYNCHGLTGALVIPNSVTSIGKSAFRQCRGIAALTVGNSVKSIGEDAFTSCLGLTGALVLPNSVTSIGSRAFFECTGLTGLSLGNSVTAIGNAAFSACNYLTGMLVLPNSVESVGYDAFKGCRRLTGLTIGHSVTSIGNNSFGTCVGLTEIISLNPTPPTIEGSAFTGMDKTVCILRVPSGSVAAYRAAAGWNEFDQTVEN